ncbi:excisionase family DNA-binding protein [Corynebacterium sp. ES2794-CONJ1]|uniref:excisionase family DNA-binding protein n=1 Tax=unclassified Corynebacterium TaxID=2624378 RepID=UPI00216AF207|nr:MULTISPECIES: excisionase family DNA-binding protein [unclassified Corynebacterium]MCS4531341.1 excisionase family DNA-binding protein [Corynebacterium sp. ES2730-CONJ]MCU9518729.1 excisionase family DNA-binding protein [Corynebacterium sp. ES2794-CONJ1]
MFEKIPAIAAVFITLKEASARVNIAERTLRKYIAEGKLRAYRNGRMIRLKPADVDALLIPTDSWGDAA